MADINTDCALDDDALAEQLERFRSIGEHAIWSRRLPSEVTVVLEPDLDDDLLQQTLAIERECCSFFALIWDASKRSLTVAARDRHEPVLDRIAEALGLERVSATSSGS
jgi:hypothetical protein